MEYFDDTIIDSTGLMFLSHAVESSIEASNGEPVQNLGDFASDTDGSAGTKWGLALREWWRGCGCRSYRDKWPQ